MTEVELIEEVARTLKTTKRVVALVLDATKLYMENALRSGESVVLTGFGSFKVEKFKKKPLFGKPREKGFWVKVKFHPSRRRLPHGEVRRSSGRREDEDSGSGA